MTPFQDSALEQLHQSLKPGEQVTAVHVESRDSGGEMPVLGGRYRVDGFVARGGMGEVYRVLDGEFDRPLALKVVQEKFRGRGDVADRFLREARVMGQLQHPGIPPVQEMGRLPDDRPYFLMKLVEGRDLNALLGERSSPADRQAYYLGVFEDVCRTVAYSHSRSIIHRDLKPHNIMVGAFGEVQVMDWGLAKVLSSRAIVSDGPGLSERPAPPSATTPAAESTIELMNTPGTPGDFSVAGAVLGTPAFMAPEQARGEVGLLDPTCDVFGLGGILCVVLTGRAPFAVGNRVDNLRRAMAGDLSDAFERLDRCGADAELVDLAKRCLAPDPGARFADAGQVAQAVAGYLGLVGERLRQAELAQAQAEIRAREESKRLALERQKRRATVALATSLLVFLTLAGVTGWWVWDREEKQVFRELLQEQHDREQAAVFGAQQELRVKQDIDQSRQLLGRSMFRQAKSILEQSLGTLTAPTDEVLRLQVMAGLDDARFVERLDKIRQDGALIVDGEMNHPATPPVYAQAFREFNFDLGADEELLAARVVASPLRDRLIVAMDDWLCWERDPAIRRRLCSIAAKATGHLWRNDLAAPWTSARALETVLSQAPVRDLSTTLLVGICWTLHSLRSDGLSPLKAATFHHPEDFWVWFYLASVQMQKGNAAAAASAYHSCLAIRKDTPVAWNNLGVALGLLHDEPGKIAAYREAVRLDPQYYLAHFNLGLSLEDVGDLPGAVASFREALRLNPKLMKGYVQLSNCLRALGDLPGALAVSEEAIRVDSQSADGHHILGQVLLDREDFPGAIREFKEAIRLDSKMVEAHTNLGAALHGIKDTPGAIQALEEAIRLKPDNAKAYFHLGVALRDDMNLKGAIAAYREAIRIDPRYAKAYYNLGNALKADNDLKGAIEAYREAVRADPKYARAWYNLGNSLTAINDHPGAVDAFRAAARFDPKDHRYLLNLGTALAATKDFPGAIMAFRAALGLNPKDARVHASLGLAIGRQEGRLASFRYFQEALAADPSLAADTMVRLWRLGAGAAVLAAVSSDDALTSGDKAAIRKQAHDWLRADLETWSKLLKGNTKAATTVMQALRGMQTAADLAAIREEQQLAKLPADEQEAWRRFWADVEKLRLQAEKEPPSGKGK